MDFEEADDCIELTHSGSFIEIRASIAKPVGLLSTQFSYDSVEHQSDPFHRLELTRAATVNVIEVHQEKKINVKQLTADAIRKGTRGNTSRQYARSLRNIRSVNKTKIVPETQSSSKESLSSRVAMRQLIQNEKKNQSARAKLDDELVQRDFQCSSDIEKASKSSSVFNKLKDEHEAAVTIQSMTRSTAARKTKNRLVVKKKVGDAQIGSEPVVSFPENKCSAKDAESEQSESNVKIVANKTADDKSINVSEINPHAKTKINNFSEDEPITPVENNVTEAKEIEFNLNVKVNIGNNLDDEDAIPAVENVDISPMVKNVDTSSAVKNDTKEIKLTDLDSKVDIINVPDDEHLVDVGKDIDIEDKEQQHGTNAEDEIETGKDVETVKGVSANNMQVCMNESTTTNSFTNSAKRILYGTIEDYSSDSVEVIVFDCNGGKAPESPRDVTEDVNAFLCKKDNKISVEDRDQGDLDTHFRTSTDLNKGDDETRESKAAVNSDELKKELEGVSSIQDLFCSTNTTQIRIQQRLQKKSLNGENDKHAITLQRAVRSDGKEEIQKVCMDERTHPMNPVIWMKNFCNKMKGQNPSISGDCWQFSFSDSVEVIVFDCNGGKAPESPRDVTEDVNAFLCKKDNKISVEDRDQGDLDTHFRTLTDLSKGDDDARESKAAVNSDELKKQKELEGVSLIQDLFCSTNTTKIRIQQRLQERSLYGENDKRAFAFQCAVRSDDKEEIQKVCMDKRTDPIESSHLDETILQRNERKKPINIWRLLAIFILFLSLLISFVTNLGITEHAITEDVVAPGQVTSLNQQVDVHVELSKEKSKLPFFKSILRKNPKKKHKAKSQREGNCLPGDVVCVEQ
eukprot:CAMPEP_0194194186 /NCGR_PEP_ID=MMETSP0154-20130528/75445_1 /TAXON_ID=1049557 /ORGANISM="Thalassiothrix antarctica, Strain L6-D1" /LENGTH=855 /DNA_ID=CAMNT_0038918589 /DNA_START=88 /DNA_END=2656 /DNA_ORIENTATION=-